MPRARNARGAAFARDVARIACSGATVHPDGKVFGVFADEGVLVAFSADQVDLQIHFIRTHASFRRQGRAKRLLGVIVDLADRHGMEMSLEALSTDEPTPERTPPTDEELAAWYGRYGFVVQGGVLPNGAIPMIRRARAADASAA